jgi:hypothetical protein
MISEYVRLAFATGIVLLPGYLVAWALGQRGASPGFVWAFGCLFLAWAAVFIVHGTISLAVSILGAIGLVAALVGASRGVRRRRVTTPAASPEPTALIRGGVFVGGAVLGIALWHVEGAVVGDALFHEGRVRKLLDLAHLHLRSVDELAHGGLHPGYAFPLWHGFLALVAKLSGLDPSVVIHREASVLVPIACLVAWEAGAAVFRSPVGGLGVLAASLGIYCFAAGNGGSYVSLALPATSSRQLMVPAAFALYFTYAESGRRVDLATVAVAFGALALVHPTYALFALIPLGAYALVRWPEWRRSWAAIGAALVPVGLTVLWLKPVIDETLPVNPSAELQARTLAHYGNELVVKSVDHFRLAAEVPGRTGAVAVAALAMVPLAGFAARRRWGAFVLGGAVAVLALMLVPELFVRFSNAVSLSQSRRAAGFVPLPFAFAGGLALLMRRAFLLPLALVAGFLLQRKWPGDFAYGLRHGGPAAITWFALVGGAVALALGLIFAPDSPVEKWTLGALAAFLFVLPVAWHGFSHWSPLNPTDKTALSPALLAQLKTLPKGAIVIASLPTSYEIAAVAPVYVVGAPIPHVANTKANDPALRAKQVAHWLATGDPAIPRMYGATWAVKGDRLIPLNGSR